MLKIDYLEAELEGLKKQYAALEDQHKKTLERLQSIESMSKQTRQELQHTKATLTETSEHLKVAQEEKIKFKMIAEDLHIKTAEAIKEMKESKAIRIRLESERGVVEEKVKSEIQGDYTGLIKGLEQENQGLRLQLEKIEREAAELKSTLQKTKDELWNTINKWHSIEKDLEGQYSKKDNNMEVLHQQREEIQQLQKKCAQLEAECKTLRGGKGNEPRKSEVVSSGVSIDPKELEKLQSENANLTKQCKELKDLVEQQKGQLAKNQTALAQTQDRVDLLKRELQKQKDLAMEAKKPKLKPGASNEGNTNPVVSPGNNSKTENESSQISFRIDKPKFVPEESKKAKAKPPQSPPEVSPEQKK